MKVSKSMKAMLLTGHGDPEKPVLEKHVAQRGVGEKPAVFLRIDHT
jgi:hypothetical protein